ncbi:unnamed protein product [Mytilus edulis]|uniref:Paired domain-containing protein n=1 Tax=Mytilus edulis TaxID=6550 RepID=A0A8S3TPS0_MYTED|nr:unnamed protein product [Mytilus edulis]
MDFKEKQERPYVGKKIPEIEIAKIKRMHQSGLTFSAISKQTGICQKTISKYICGVENNYKVKQPKRDIMTEEVLKSVEFFKYSKPSLTYSEIRKKLVVNGICNQQNVPTAKYLSHSCVHELGYSYKKLETLPVETQKDDIQLQFDNFVEFISQKNPIKGSRAFELQRYASNANYTINLLHSRFGVDYFNVIDGSSNSLELINFFAEAIDINNDKLANGHQPLFVPGDTIIMDNCAFHHSRIVNTNLPHLLRPAGITLKYQPPYHPQLNTCEYCFHIIKQILRSNSDYTFDHTRAAICDARNIYQLEQVTDSLKEIVKEASRQKFYLDRLISVVIEESPWILDQVDAQFDDNSLVNQSEEFC